MPFMPNTRVILHDGAWQHNWFCSLPFAGNGIISILMFLEENNIIIKRCDLEDVSKL